MSPVVVFYHIGPRPRVVGLNKMKCPKCQINNAKQSEYGPLWCDDCNKRKEPSRKSFGIGGQEAQAVFEDSSGKQYTTNAKGNIVASPKFYPRKYKAKKIYL